MTIEKEIEEFERLTRQMAATFKRKRNDYGQSTTETFEKFGSVSMLTRMHDKMARLDRLLWQNVERTVENEAVQDTLMDLANYALITIIELDKYNAKLKDITHKYKAEIEKYLDSTEEKMRNVARVDEGESGGSSQDRTDV